MADPKITRSKRALFERIGWSVATRDDRAVAKAVADGDELDAVYGLEQAGLLDAFMAFLGDIGLISYLEGMKASTRQRFIVPTCVVLLTYMTKVLMGIEHLYSMPDVLFSDPGVMKVIGMNARWLSEGLCNRSHEKRGEGKEPPKPFSAQMIGNFLSSLTISESAALFNEAIRCLAASKAFPSEITLVIDGTDVETTDKCQGIGRVIRDEKIPDSAGPIKTVPVEVHGFKAIVAFDLTTEIPLGVIVTKINRHESLFTRRLVEQVQANLSPSNGKITKVLVDRGFIDGETMWWLDQQGISFVVPAKSNMLVYKGAHEESKANKGVVQSRTRSVTHGHGRNKTVEHLETEIIGISNLPYWESYNDPEKAKSRMNRGYIPKHINAVVVRKWNNHDYGPAGKGVFLTNQPVNKPFLIFDDYDRRSLIENALFREGKQGWALEKIPQKTQRAAVAHIFITFAMIALTMAYRSWMKQEEDDHEKAVARIKAQGSSLRLHTSEELGIRKWRIELAQLTRDFSIIFVGESYGLFHMAEVMVLSGRKVKEIPRKIGTISDIYRRYGLQPPD